MEDADEIAAIYLGSRRRHLAFVPLIHSESEVRRWIRQLLTSPRRCLVVEDAGRVGAFMITSSSERGSWIEHLYVHPDVGSRGHGSALVEVAKRELTPPVQLHTFQENRRARKFYERFGFVAVGTTDGTDNEERCPDVLYRWDGEHARSASGDGSR